MNSNTKNNVNTPISEEQWEQYLQSLNQPARGQVIVTDSKPNKHVTKSLVVTPNKKESISILKEKASSEKRKHTSYDSGWIDTKKKKNLSSNVAVDYDTFVSKRSKEQDVMTCALSQNSNNTFVAEKVDVIKPRSKMKKHRISTDIETMVLKHKGDPFEHPNVVNHKEKHCESNRNRFAKFVERAEGHRKDQKFIESLTTTRSKVRHDSTTFKIVDLKKCGHKKCQGCGKLMTNCHDVMFGAFCYNKVVRYATYCSPNDI